MQPNSPRTRLRPALAFRRREFRQRFRRGVVAVFAVEPPLEPARLALITDGEEPRVAVAAHDLLAPETGAVLLAVAAQRLLLRGPAAAAPPRGPEPGDAELPRAGGLDVAVIPAVPVRVAVVKVRLDPELSRDHQHPAIRLRVPRPAAAAALPDAVRDVEHPVGERAAVVQRHCRARFSPAGGERAADFHRERCRACGLVGVGRERGFARGRDPVVCACVSLDPPDPERAQSAFGESGVAVAKPAVGGVVAVAVVVVFAAAAGVCARRAGYQDLLDVRDAHEPAEPHAQHLQRIPREPENVVKRASAGRRRPVQIQIPQARQRQRRQQPRLLAERRAVQPHRAVRVSQPGAGPRAVLRPALGVLDDCGLPLAAESALAYVERDVPPRRGIL